MHLFILIKISASTVQDLSTLIDFLPAYISPYISRQQSLYTHFTLGVSLGGHSTWLSLVHEPRVTAGVVIVGCPDYIALMADRARLSKLSSWLGDDNTHHQDGKTQPQSPLPGSSFLGSQHFPKALLDIVQRKDPSAVLSGSEQQIALKKIDFIRTGVSSFSHLPEMEEDSVRLRSILNHHLRGKRILCLSGASDKLVPYRLFEPFMTWLKKGLAPGGWGRFVNEKEEERIYLEDLVFENTAHELTEPMMQEVLRFIYESVVSLDKESDVMRSSL